MKDLLRCSRCRKMWPPEDFYTRSDRPGRGRTYCCKKCYTPVIAAKWVRTKEVPSIHAAHRARNRRNCTTYRATNPVARKISTYKHFHGMTPEEAAYWAAKVTNPYSRCSVCGLPQRILAAYRRLGTAGLGTSRFLTVDHISPRAGATRENLRLLCYRCNSTRGAAMYSDAEVLKKVTRWWRRRKAEEELWWLTSGADIAKKGRKHDGPLPPDPAQPAH
jgi:5-methylcytosine-specific restriction endonuclease McrA